MLVPAELRNFDLKTDSMGPQIQLRELQDYTESRIGKAEAYLEKFIKFELIRGSNDSAPIEDFEFSVQLYSFTEHELVLQFKFIKPLSISIGQVAEMARVTLLNTDLFYSSESGKTLEKEKVYELSIPRQFRNNDEKETIENTGEVMKTAADTGGALNILITFLMGISLKALWIFMNHF